MVNFSRRKHHKTHERPESRNVTLRNDSKWITGKRATRIMINDFDHRSKRNLSFSLAIYERKKGFQDSTKFQRYFFPFYRKTIKSCSFLQIKTSKAFSLLPTTLRERRNKNINKRVRARNFWCVFLCGKGVRHLTCRYFLPGYRSKRM